MKKLFVSVPMKGRTEKAIKKSIKEMHKIAEIAFGEKLEVIDSYFESNSECTADSKMKNWSLFCLGKSIEAMAKADYFIGIDSWYDADICRGCDSERNIARYYGIQSVLISARDYAFLKDVFTIVEEPCLTCDKG